MQTAPHRADQGWQRRRQTRRSVRIVDRLARNVIAVGGIGTILAISTVGVFLVWVVAPLFRSAHVEREVHLPAAPGTAAPLHVAVDDEQLLGLSVGQDGVVSLFDLHDGRQLATLPIAAGRRPSASAFPPAGDEAYFGFPDGTLCSGTLRFTTTYPAGGTLPERLATLRPGERVPFQDGLLEATADGEFRLHGVAVDLDDAVGEPSGVPVVLVDGSSPPGGRVIAALDADGALRVFSQRARRDMMTGRTEWSTRMGSFQLPPLPGRDMPQHLLLSGLGDWIYLAWADGQVLRLDSSDLEHVAIAETADLVPAPAARLTALEFLLGKSTLVAGDSRGGLRAWLPLAPAGAIAGTARHLTVLHDLGESGAAVRELAASSRTRLMAVGFADGRIELVHLTSQRHLARLRLPPGQAATALAVAPKENGLLAWGDRGRWRWELDPRHPEAGLAALFLPVWYEGYPAPEHVWQSSSGTDDAEPKLGMWPLVFGTLKATFYSHVARSADRAAGGGVTPASSCRRACDRASSPPSS